MFQESSWVFPLGEAITNNNFTGKAYLQMLISPDSIYQTSLGNVTFEHGARTRWHKHPGGQILLVTAGSGFYQAKGTHIAISLNLDQGNVVWLQPVSSFLLQKRHLPVN